jgi:hypothetical protein
MDPYGHPGPLLVVPVVFGVKELLIAGGIISAGVVVANADVQNIELPRWRDAGPKKKNTGTKKRAQQRKKRKCKRLWDNYQVHCLPCDCTMTKEQLDAAIQCYKLQIERRNRYLKQNCDDVLGYGKKSKKKHEGKIEKRRQQMRECERLRKAMP